MASEYRKKVLAMGMVLAVSAVYGKAPLMDAFALQAHADDGESEDSSSEDDSNESEDKKKAEEKKREAAKKVAEIRKESQKKIEEIKRESAKKAYEVKKEAEKKQLEMLKEESEAEDEDMEEADDNEEEGEEIGEVENGDEPGKVNESRYRHASEKIAEAEKYILEQQTDGRDMTIALERLAQAKSMLALSEESADKLDAKELIKESLKLAHTAEKDDVHEINDANKFVRKASQRIEQATKKLSQLSALGGDVSSYQTMIDAASADLKSAQDTLSQGSLLDSVALAKKAEAEAKAAKKAIESALLALGVSDDDLSGDHKSVVAQAVEDLLFVAGVEGENGIGKQIREIAKAQRDSAEKVDELVDDAQSRTDIEEFILGPNYDDLTDIEKEIAENQARIQSLTAAASEITDTDLKEVVEEHADALTSENDKLRSFVTGKEKQRGIFGWVFRLLQ